MKLVVTRHHALYSAICNLPLSRELYENPSRNKSHHLSHTNDHFPQLAVANFQIIPHGQFHTNLVAGSSIKYNLSNFTNLLKLGGSIIPEHLVFNKGRGKGGGIWIISQNNQVEEGNGSFNGYFCFKNSLNYIYLSGRNKSWSQSLCWGVPKPHTLVLNTYTLQCNIPLYQCVFIIPFVG